MVDVPIAPHVPVIDLTGTDDPGRAADEARNLDVACRRHGVFELAGHEVPAGLHTELFGHRNTLRSRVARLESLLGPFTDDPDRRAAVFVAMELHRLDHEGDDIGGSPLSGRRSV
jgi:hypothetical protein